LACFYDHLVALERDNIHSLDFNDPRVQELDNLSNGKFKKLREQIQMEKEGRHLESDFGRSDGNVFVGKDEKYPHSKIEIGESGFTSSWSVKEDIYHKTMISHSMVSSIKSIWPSRAREGKLWFMKFEDDEFDYGFRPPFFHNIVWCHRGEFEKRKETARSWWFMDIITYHMDRILDFHIVPHTSSALFPLDQILPFIDMRRRKLGSLSKSDIEAQLDCVRTKDDFLIIDDKKHLFGSLQIKLDMRDKPVKRSLFHKWDWRNNMPHCIGDDNCFVSRTSASKMWLLDFILGTVDRDVNAFFYGSSTSKEYRQGALVDNDRIWEAKLDDFVLPKVEKCEETSAQLSCLDASVVERFYSFNNENLLSKKIVASLKREPLYKWSSVFRAYVDDRDWTFVDGKAKTVADYGKKYNIPRVKEFTDISDTGMFPFYFG